MFDEVVMIVSERKAVRIRLSASGRERRDRLTREGKCLSCEKTMAGEKHPKLGNHNSCYLKAYHLIRTGQKTLEQLIRSGFVLVPTKGGRKPSEISKKLMEA